MYKYIQTQTQTHTHTHTHTPVEGITGAGTDFSTTSIDFSVVVVVKEVELGKVFVVTVTMLEADAARDLISSFDLINSSFAFESSSRVRFNSLSFSVDIFFWINEI